MATWGSGAMSLEDIEQKWRPSTVYISVEAQNDTGAIVSSSGSGFVVSSTGYVLTAGHLIPTIPKGSNRHRKITGSPESRYGMGEELDYIGHDPISDFALLKFKNTAIKRIPVHFGDPGQFIRQGSEMYALGFPLRQEFIATPGRLTGTGGLGGMWITNMALNPGNSGGPVFNEQGEVVGMVSSELPGAEGIKYILPIYRAQSLLNDINIAMRYLPKDTPQSLKNEDPVRGKTSISSADIIETKEKIAVVASTKASKETTVKSRNNSNVRGNIIKDCETCPEMVVILSDEFEMGSSNGDFAERPVHQVHVGTFALAKTEVTQGQWRAVMGSNPSHFSNCGDDCPVENVSWNEAWNYIHKLSAKTDKLYRLPSEAEWEYACRAGGKHELCGSDSVDIVAWYDGNSGMSTHPVGYKRPNAFGLYDMSGNVGEWVGDSWHENYSGAPTDGSAWLDDERYVIRGGSWDDSSKDARATKRGEDFGGGLKHLGFRVALVLEDTVGTLGSVDPRSVVVTEKKALEEAASKLSADAHTIGKIVKDCDICPEMVVIPPGQFEMGSDLGDRPVHDVLVNTFALGKTEVTQGQWRAVMGNNPSHYNLCGDDCPVENVSWIDAQAFIQKLNALTSMQYRLPSEAEWEYACRAGQLHQYCGSDNLDSVAWYYENNGKKTQPVGHKMPNTFGLYDMMGNVAEWMEDSWHDNYNGAPTDGSAWPGNGWKRVVRSGNCLHFVAETICITRDGAEPTLRFQVVGFRVARMLQSSEDGVGGFESNLAVVADKKISEQTTPKLLGDINARVNVFKDCKTCPEMLAIPSGEFLMGSNIETIRAQPTHRVKVDAFALSKTEVTQGQWRRVMGNNPSFYSNCGDSCPVEKVSWNDVQEYLQKLSTKTGKEYRLPSEAEWEYACRAGGQQKYCGSNKVASVAWYIVNSGNKTHSVGHKQANTFGLYDMSGNVAEWMEDSWHANYEGAPTDGSAWQGDGLMRVLRGGSHRDELEVHSVYRFFHEHKGSSMGIGFRVARRLIP
ncbi:MAG: SUMF1/EgtB/PvdO family nonheme iron enzyme [Candidatus Nitrotoga sp.]|nr:SUMF1/EgtB/PvdO family nonheme iron enzyme [Candidatus Nitrotoga sp.]